VEGESESSSDMLLDISTDTSSFEGESYTRLTLGDMSGESRSGVSAWADLEEPMSAGIKRLEIAISGDSGLGVPLELPPLSLAAEFEEPLAMNFSGGVGAVAAFAGEGEISVNDGIPQDASFFGQVTVLDQDLTVDVPYGTVDQVVAMVVEMTSTTVEGSVSTSNTFYVHPDLGLVAADVSTGFESIALAGLATQ
jgi:hypothetical protein